MLNYHCYIEEDNVMITKNQQLYFTNINIFSANNDKFPFIASVQEKKVIPCFFLLFGQKSFMILF